MDARPGMEVPGLSPRSPVSVVAPVFVTVELPSTAKLPASPRIGPASAGEAMHSAEMNGIMTESAIVSRRYSLACLCRMLTAPQSGRTRRLRKRRATEHMVGERELIASESTQAAASFAKAVSRPRGSDRDDLS